MSDKQNSLIQFETGDLPNSRARHYKKAKTHSYLFPFFLLVSLCLLSLLFFQFFQCSLLSKTSSNQSKEIEDLKVYISNQEQMNMFTANKRYTEKEILDQIFYPYGSDIIYTLDELNLLRIWTGMAGLHLVLKSSVSGDSIENFQSKTNSERSYIVLVKTKKGHRFGAYTSVNFKPNEYAEIIVDVTKPDDKAFLFSLDKKEKYMIKNIDNAIVCDESIAVSMGEGDLVITDNFLKHPSQTSYSKNFEGESPFGLTFGDKEFEVEELEVFHVYSA